MGGVTQRQRLACAACWWTFPPQDELLAAQPNIGKRLVLRRR